MRFLILSEKAAPPMNGGVAGPAMTEDPTLEEEVAAHEWAGDLVDEGAESVSEPAAAFAAFGGGEGEQAWLDRADDGTLVGWVRDADGSLYRYVDADAWAVDVDDAQMAQGEAGAPMEGDPAAEGDPMAEGDPLAEDPLAEDPLAAEDELLDDDDMLEDDEMVDEEEVGGEEFDADGNPMSLDDGEPVDDEDLDDPDDPFRKKKKGQRPFKVEGKQLVAVRHLTPVA